MYNSNFVNLGPGRGTLCETSNIRKIWFTLSEASKLTGLSRARLKTIADKNPNFVRDKKQQYWLIKIHVDLVEILLKLKI